MPPNLSALAFARLAGALIMLIGALILLGWYLERGLIAHGVSGNLTIIPNAAAGLFLAGLGLLALTYDATRPVARILGLFLILAACVLLFLDITGQQSNIRHVLIENVLGRGNNSPIENMSPGAITAFLLIGMVLVLTARKSMLLIIAVELLLAAVFTLAIINLIGHGFAVGQGYNPFPFTAMAGEMAVLLVIIIMGLSAACPDRGFARVLLDPSTGGQMFRRLMPGILFFPIIVGWAVHMAMQNASFSTATGIAAITVLTILVMAGFAWVIAIALKQSDSARDEALVELHNQRESLRTTLVSIADAVIVVDRSGNVVLMNPVAEKLIGCDLAKVGDHNVEKLFPVYHELTATKIENPALLAQREKRIVGLDECHLKQNDGQNIPIEYVSSPILSRNNRVDGAVLIFRDISERRQAEEQQMMMVRELNHRVRNVLMIVQSIVQASAEHTKDKNADEMVRVLLDRLRSLGRAHELLLDSHWTGANLRKMVELELEPYSKHDQDKIVVKGGDVMLPPQCTSIVAMSLHELATNAAKYGALSVKNGGLSVTWSVRRSKLTIKWVESNIKVQKHQTAGFGSTLIEKGIKQNLGGEAKHQFTDNGLTVTLKIPLPDETA